MVLRGANTGKLGNYEHIYCQKRPQILHIDAILWSFGYSASFTGVYWLFLAINALTDVAMAEKNLSERLESL